MIDYELMNEWFYYDETSPSCLRWKKSRYVGKSSNILRASENQIAGSKGDRYWCVGLNGKIYKVHHVILVLHNKQSGKPFTDHIDGNNYHNVITNLRVSTCDMNSRNRKMSRKNTSGVTGVNLHSNKYWRVTWYENRKLKCKFFSIQKLGNEVSFELTVKFRNEIINELNSKGYSYSERHGK